MTIIIPLIASPASQDRASDGDPCITYALAATRCGSCARDRQALAVDVKLSYSVEVFAEPGLRFAPSRLRCHPRRRLAHECHPNDRSCNDDAGADGIAR